MRAGVRRAFPYVEEQVADKLIAEHTPHLFALAHHERSFPTAVQALCLLYQVCTNQPTTHPIRRVVSEHETVVESPWCVCGRWDGVARLRG
jgi:hypothetical protein